MRHLNSEFHFRHALFALQGPDGYVDALLGSARDTTPAPALCFRRPRARPTVAPTLAAPREVARSH